MFSFSHFFFFLLIQKRNKSHHENEIFNENNAVRKERMNLNLMFFLFSFLFIAFTILARKFRFQLKN